MTDFFVTNSLNPSMVVRFSMTLRYFVVKSESGNYAWTLEIGTNHLDKDGYSISPARVHRLVDEVILDEIIKSAVANLCSKIDWTPYIEDNDPPELLSVYPSDGSTVSITSNVVIKLKDSLPSSGIDISEMVVIINNGEQSFDISSEFEYIGDPFDLELRWSPPLRVCSRYV